MRLYVLKKDREVLDACIAASQLILSDVHATPEAREKAERVIAQGSGAIMSPLLPYGLTRNLLMLCFLALGMLGFFTSYGWLWLFFPAALLFSPRIVGELGILYGQAERKFERGRDRSA